MQEIIDRRTYNKKVFDLGIVTDDSGKLLQKKQYDCHIGHIHFKDEFSTFQDVDYTIVDKVTYWEMVKANYHIFVYKDFLTNRNVEFINKYNGANHSITYDPYSIYFVDANNTNIRTLISEAQASTGVLNGNTIRYSNAFGEGIHFEITLRRSGFIKEIIIDSKASLGNSPYTNYFILALFKWETVDIGKNKGLMVKSKDVNNNLVNWDKKNTIFQVDEFIVEDNTGFKSYIKPAFVQDSGSTNNKKKELISVFYENKESLLWQGKLIPKSFIDSAIYPIRADTVTTYYIGAGDGHVQGPVTSTWAATHDAVSGIATNGATSIEVYSYGVSGVYIVMRGFFPVDTSGIGDTDTIDSATFNGYVPSKVNGDNDGDDWINIVGPTTQNSTSTLQNDDLIDCGAITNPTEGATRIDIGNITTGAFNVWTLNATGLSWINKTGWTMLGMREGHDCINSAIGNAHDEINVRTSEYAGSSSDPYLSVITSSSAVIYSQIERGIRGLERGLYGG